MLLALMTPLATRYLLWGLVAHLVCDWLFQNHWMAANKSRFVKWREVYRAFDGGLEYRSPLLYFPHPAGLVHALIHVVGLLLVYPPQLWWVAFAVGVTHWLIDLRLPLVWWRAFYKQTTDPKNPASLHVSFWGDQVTHILVLAVVAMLLGR